MPEIPDVRGPSGNQSRIIHCLDYVDQLGRGLNPICYSDQNVLSHSHYTTAPLAGHGSSMNKLPLGRSLEALHRRIIVTVTLPAHRHLQSFSLLAIYYVTILSSTSRAMVSTTNSLSPINYALALLLRHEHGSFQPISHTN